MTVKESDLFRTAMRLATCQHKRDNARIQRALRPARAAPRPIARSKAAARRSDARGGAVAARRTSLHLIRKVRRSWPSQADTHRNPARQRPATAMPQINALAQYIKDLSVENPSAPQVFQWQASRSSTSSSTSTSTASATRSTRSSCKIELTAASDQGAHFLVDLSYAGLFGLRNMPEDALRAVPAGRGAAPAVPVRPPDRRRRGPEHRLPAAAARPDRLRRRLHGAARGSSRPAGATARRRAARRRRAGRQRLTRRPAPHEPRQGDGHDRRADAGQPRRGLRPRHADVAGCMGASCAGRRLLRRLPAAQHLPPAVRRRRLLGRVRAAVQPAAARRGRRGGRRSNFSEEVLAVFLPTLVLFTLVFEIIMPARSSRLISGYHGDKLDARDLPDPDHLPLSDADQPGLAVLGHPQLACHASPPRPSRPALLNLAMLVALIFVPDGGDDRPRPRWRSR